MQLKTKSVDNNVLKKVLCFLFVIVEVFGLYEGEKCRLPNHDIGECRTIENCKTDFGDKITRFSKSMECELVANQKLVCCPKDVRRNIVKRHAYRAKYDIDDGDIFFGNEEELISSLSSSTPRDIVIRGDFADGRGAEKANQACNKYMKGRPDIFSKHILAGENARDGEFPHMVALGYTENNNKLDFKCGGTLISERFVATAAHCVIRNKPSIVRVGSIFLNSKDAVDYAIIQQIVHPDYKPSFKYHDLALLRLERDVSTNSNVYFTACLDTEFDNPTSNLIVSGWGIADTVTMAKSTRLLKANLTAVSQNECQQAVVTGLLVRKLPNGIIGSQMCAVDRNQISDTCPGDSGGPLQVPLQVPTEGMYKIVGITSFGKQGCGNGKPGVYTRVSQYLDWIAYYVWP